ncbi:MAG: helix-turn-helix domain-containing protein [Clostridia bacterium]|nr:helix-turn-helix domain-containing protein [Clostridia bacterium]
MIHLLDLWTTQQVPLASKLTNTMDHYFHDHTFFEIFYMVEGSISHTLNGVTETLTTGDIYFLKPDDAHFFSREESNKDFHRDIILQKDFFKEVCQFISPDLYENFINNKYKKRISLTINELNHFEELLNDINALPLSRTDLILASAKAVAVQLLTKLLLCQHLESISYPAWFQDLLLRLNNVDLIKAGLGEILAPFYYSKEYICRSFKRHMNMTLTDYLNDQRLTIAAHSLTYSKNSILSICTDIGFSSVSYFNKIFKQKYSCTPLEFRKKQLNF